MGQATNIIIKKSDGVTNVTYSVQAASSGDKNPARYSDTAFSVVPNLRPSFSITAQASGSSGVVRRVDLNGAFDIVDPVSGLSVGRVTLKNAQIFIPQNVSSLLAKEGIHQLLNLCASTEVKAACESGFAGT